MQNLSRRRFVATTLAAGAALALPSLSYAEGGSLADIKKRGKLTVGTEAAYEPFEFVENGKVHELDGGTWAFGGPRSSQQVVDEIVGAVTS